MAKHDTRTIAALLRTFGAIGTIKSLTVGPGDTVSVEFRDGSATETHPCVAADAPVSASDDRREAWDLVGEESVADRDGL